MVAASRPSDNELTILLGDLLFCVSSLFSLVFSLVGASLALAAADEDDMVLKLVD
jgi:hypothetical protein